MNGSCKIPYRKFKFGQFAFSIKGCQLWNTLLTEIKLTSDLKSVTTKVSAGLKQTRAVATLSSMCSLTSEGY